MRIFAAMTLCVLPWVPGCAQRLPMEAELRYRVMPEPVAKATVEIGTGATMPLTLVASGRTDDHGRLLVRVPAKQRLHLRITDGDGRVHLGMIHPASLVAQWSEWEDLVPAERVNPVGEQPRFWIEARVRRSME
jgi:hypothetical protein